MAKSGCQKISDYADQLERQRKSRCPRRASIEASQRRQAQFNQGKKVVGQIFGTGRTIFSELDRRLSGTPQRRTRRRR